MSSLGAHIRTGGVFDTFVPHEDGLEFANLLEPLKSFGVDETKSKQLLSAAIFALDLYMVIQGCDGLVANLNGRVPDEGTIVEATTAFILGKPLVLYKDDSRSLLEGADNPMVLGMTGGKVVARLEDVREVLSKAFEDSPPRKAAPSLPQDIVHTLEVGEHLRSALLSSSGVQQIAGIIVHFAARLA
jgi:nucleoside 2-deoxyribosyltransferase